MNPNDKPLVTFVVPCYNSASFMSRAVDSLLEANHPCEILLINDGSTDDTSEVAHAYAAKHDNVIAVDQENANWGGAVNHGLELARGRYFKVLDSDDHFEAGDLHAALDALAQAIDEGNEPDLLITNYVYDHLSSGTQRLMHYRQLFPQGRIFTWSEVGKQSSVDHFIMIHASWYATRVLRESGVLLPTGMSYMDSILLLHPLPYVKKLLYLDVSPYYYAIGREGQTVDVEVITKHIDEQLFCAMLAIDDYDYAELHDREPKLADVMCGYMLCMLSVSTLNLMLIGTPEALAKNDALWAYLKEHDPYLYKRVHLSWVGLCNRRTKLGRLLVLRGFSFVKKIYKLE